MFARVNTMQFPPEHTEEFAALVSFLCEQVMPAFKRLPGHAQGYWLADRDHGKLIAMGFWETMKSMRASETVNQQFGKTAEALGAVTLSVDRYEVIGSVEAGGVVAPA